MDNSQFIGKICPYCRTEFKEDDDIVVCSECDMPHHKECWIENQGCTTFGCLGTIQNPTPNIFTQPNLIFCTRCGHQNFNTNTFCTVCGHRLFVPVQQPPFQQSAPLPFPQHNLTQQQAGTSQQPQPLTQPNPPVQQVTQIWQPSPIVTQPNLSAASPNVSIPQQAASPIQAPIIPQQGSYVSSPPMSSQMPTNTSQSASQTNPLFTSQPAQLQNQNPSPSLHSLQQSSPNADPFKNSYMQYMAQMNQQYFSMSPESYALELAFIQDNTDYYIPKFISMRTEGKKIKWNWAAFFLSYFWMFYRKMYLFASAVLVVSVLFSLIRPAAFFLSLAISMFMGMMGNYMYMYHVKQSIEKFNEMPVMLRDEALSKKGGTNIALPLIVFGAILLFAILINL